MHGFLPRRWRDRNAGRLTGALLITLFYLPAVQSYDEPLVTRVTASLAHDDNVANAALSRDRRDDVFLGLDTSLNRLLQPTLFWSLELEAALRIREYNRYTRLGFVAPEVTGRASYRPAGGFLMPTFSGHLSAAWRDYRSQARDGALYRAGLQIRQPLTTRIDAHLRAEQTHRRADNRVFDYRFRSFGLSADWRFASQTSLYIGIGRRQGDLVSTSRDYNSLKNAADAWIADDAFPNAAAEQLAYRIDARADQYSIGLNQALSEQTRVGLLLQHQDASGGYSTSYQRNLVMVTLVQQF